MKKRHFPKLLRLNSLDFLLYQLENGIIYEFKKLKFNESKQYDTLRYGANVRMINANDFGSAFTVNMILPIFSQLKYAYTMLMYDRFGNVHVIQ